MKTITPLLILLFLSTIVFGQREMFSSSCSMSVFTENISCNGMCNGSAMANATGVAPFIYQWQTGDTGNSTSNLCPGTYTLMMTDSTGCNATQTFTITEPSPINFTNTPRSPCYGMCDGEVTVFVTGGTPPYQYQWSNGSTINIIFDCAGNYNLCVTDSNHCILCDTISIPALTPLLLNATITNASCDTCNDGSVTINPSGSRPPYVYSWVGGFSTSARTNLLPGFYYGCVADSNFCHLCDSFEVGNLTSVNEINQENYFFVSPNPFTSKIVVRLNDYENKKSTLKIFNLIGEKVYQQQSEIMQMNFETQSEINLAFLSRGIYFLTLQIGNEIFREKIVKY